MIIDLNKRLEQSVEFADSIDAVFIQSMTNGLLIVCYFNVDTFENVFEVLTWELENGEVTTNSLHNLKPFETLNEAFGYIYSYPNVMKIS